MWILACNESNLRAYAHWNEKVIGVTTCSSVDSHQALSFWQPLVQLKMPTFLFQWLRNGPSCGLTIKRHKMIVNYRGMYEVSLAGEAGPVIPAFEAYCCLATGQSTYRWSTHLDSLMSEEDPVEALNGTLGKLRRWSGRALKRILGEFGSGSWARRRVLQWFTWFDVSRCYVMKMPVRPRKKILCGVGRGSCVSLEGLRITQAIV